jgi:proteasome regulatory subunit
MNNQDEVNSMSTRLDDDPLYNISFENQKLEDENKNLKRTVQFYQTELEKFRTPPYVVSEIISITPKNQALVKLPNQSNFLVEISQEITDLIPGDMVLNEQKSLIILGKVDMTKNFSVDNYVVVSDKLDSSWKQIGGLTKEINKVKEVLELPLLKPELFREIGITPPKGVLLYGPPGTGKTMIAKALAAETNSTFIELVGSELVQKFIGEGAKLVKDLFEMARKRAPSIIFIDEIDSIASRRVELGTGGEREAQRTFMQLLGEIDGFNALDNVKVIAATNRIDTLDEAIIRPGRLERHIEVGLPDRDGRIEILEIYVTKMKVEILDLKEIANQTENFTGAELKALTTEAGYIAIRGNKKKVTQQNFLDAIEVIAGKEEEDFQMLGHSYS